MERAPLNSFLGTTKPPLESFVLTPEPAKQPGYFERVKEDIRNVGTEIKQAVQKPSETFLLRDVARAGLRSAGAVAGGAVNVLAETPGIKQVLEFTAQKLADIPGADQVIAKATQLSERFPEASKDVQNIIDIAAFGYAPAAGKLIAPEARAITSDVAQLGRIVLTPSEEVVQSKIVSLFNKSIKPTPKKTLAQAQRYENDTINALKTIKANADNLQIEDATGELVARTPQTINELAQAVDQTKKLVFDQYDDLARQAGTGGAVVDARPIAEEVLKVAQNKALQITNPELVKYAESWAERLTVLGQIDTQTVQEVVKNLNNSLTAFYRNPTFDSATRVAIDAGITNNFRRALDEAIEGATGAQYQALKSQYSALKAIENDVVRASMRDARRNMRGLLDYTDIFTGGQMISGIFTLNPAMFTKGAVERGIKQYIKILNDPNRAVSNIFNKLDTTAVPPFAPTSATFEYLQNPKLGLSIEDVSNNLTQEARKYKSAEEFVKAQDDIPVKDVAFHGTQAKEIRGVPNKTKGTMGNAFYLAESADEALKFGTDKGVMIGGNKMRVSGAYQKANKFTFDLSNLRIKKFKNDAEFFDFVKDPDIEKWFRLAGYDGAYITKHGNYAIYNTEKLRQIPTKSQLTDIWERANKKQP